MITEYYRETRRIVLLSAWPHRTRPKTGVAIVVTVALLRAAVLIAAAYYDGALRLPGEAVGLFEHPGVLGIVVGDAILFLLCVYASRMTRCIGRRLPTDRRSLVQRYFRLVILRRIFDGSLSSFNKLLVFFSMIGALSLVNQTVQLNHATAYYGHDTFDSISHVRSFWVMRANLFVSWCIVIPLFASYLVAHTFAIRNFFRRCDKHGLVKFQPGHPDQHGGFTFFGWLDTLYAVGLLTTLIEVFLMIITHRRVTIGNLLSLTGITVGVVSISVLSIYEVLRVVRRQERLLKMASFVRTVRESRPLSVEYLALVYSAKFSPYSTTALRLAVALRAATVIPVAIRVMAYITSKL